MPAEWGSDEDQRQKWGGGSVAGGGGGGGSGGGDDGTTNGACDEDAGDIHDDLRERRAGRMNHPVC